MTETTEKRRCCQGARPCTAQTPVLSMVREGATLHKDVTISEHHAGGLTPRFPRAGFIISNLWYCNFSDRNHCRITGMPRCVCLWVELGKPVAPVNVMRFDDSIYHILGDRLEGLPRECGHILDSSYEWRSDASARLAGALVNDFTFAFTL